MNGMKTDCFEAETVHNLELRISCADFRITAAADKRVLVEAENIETEKYTCRVEGDTLIVEYGRREKIVQWDNTKIVLSLPEGIQFNQVQIENGAGSLRIAKEKFICKTMNVQIGAGMMEADNITTSERMNVEVGAGSISMNHVTTDYLNAQCGVGSFTLRGKVGHDVTVDCGMGRCGLKLEGRENDYNYDVACALGSVRINGNGTGGFGSKQRWTNTGAIGNMNLNCGMGKIDLQMTDK